MEQAGDKIVDAELVLRFQGGEESAFEALVRRHLPEAYAFSLRLTGREDEAEEIAQEGFVHAYRALGDFRGESAFRSWLFRILINLHRDRLRRRGREEIRLNAAREAAERRSNREGESSALHARELAEVVKVKIRSLPDRQREVLVLHLYSGLRYEEIARILDVSYDDVKMNLSLARKRLRSELAEYL